MLSYDTPLPVTPKFLHTGEHTHSRSILWTASLLNRAQNLSYTRDYKQHNPFVGVNDTLFVVLFSLSDNILWSAITLVVYKLVKVWLLHQELVLFSQLTPLHYAVLTAHFTTTLPNTNALRRRDMQRKMTNGGV